MKKIFFAAGFVSLITTATCAQTQANSIAYTGKKEDKKEERLIRREINEAEPSDRATEQFAVDFPNATNISWEKTDYYMAEFTNEGKTMHAFYDWEGNLIGTTTAVDYSKIPAAAQKKIEKDFKGYQKGEVLLFDDNEYNDADMNLFDTSFEGADNYFVTLKKDNSTIILQVDMVGDVSFFKSL